MRTEFLLPEIYLSERLSFFGRAKYFLSVISASGTLERYDMLLFACLYFVNARQNFAGRMLVSRNVTLDIIGDNVDSENLSPQFLQTVADKSPAGCVTHKRFPSPHPKFAVSLTATGL